MLEANFWQDKDNSKKVIKENCYDLILIDCPPTMGHIVTAANLFADLTLIPLNPNKFIVKGLKILKEEAQNLQRFYNLELKYKVFLNKFNGNTILSDKIINTVMTDEYKNQNALATAIRRSQEVENIIDNGLTLFSHLRKSEAREDYRKKSITSEAVNGVICGFGENGYVLAIDAIKNLIYSELK